MARKKGEERVRISKNQPVIVARWSWTKNGGQSLSFKATPSSSCGPRGGVRKGLKRGGKAQLLHLSVGSPE